MNKREMEDRLAARNGLGKAVAKDAVDGVFEVVVEVLAFKPGKTLREAVNGGGAS